MSEHGATRGPEVSRRTVLRGAAALGAAVAAGLAGSRRTPTALAHNLQPGEFQDAYEAAVGVPALHYQLYQYVNVQNRIIWSNIRNGLNGSQFSYGEPPGGLKVVVQCYDSANIATYNDLIWEKYQLGAKHGVTDPATGQPAVRNIFYPRTTTGGADDPPSDPQSLMNDTGMAGLMERGVTFLT